jgi:predicted dehydrogenase
MKSISGTVNWGIVGCGDVCEVKSGPAFNKVSDSKLVAVMRRDKALAEDYAKRHGVAKYYSDAAALIHDPEVNAVYIATPPSFHEEYLLEGMKAGKPVYVEKPVTVNALSCERMIEYSHSYGMRASVAHYRRGLPLFIKVKSLIQSGAIGSVRLIRLSTQQPKASKIITQTRDQWRVKPELSGGGLFHDLSPHQLDIMYWIFGAPKEVVGRSLNQSKQYDAPDMSSLEAIYKNEVFLQGIWSFNVAEAAADDTCEIIGDKGKLKFSFFKKSTVEVTTDGGTEILEFDYPVNIQQPMIEGVTRYFKGEGPNPCSLEDSLVVMKMMDATR